MLLRDPVVNKFLCSPLHEGSFKACGGSYHNRAFHVSMSAGVSISAVMIMQ